MLCIVLRESLEIMGRLTSTRETFTLQEIKDAIQARKDQKAFNEKIFNHEDFWLRNWQKFILDFTMFKDFMDAIDKAFCSAFLLNSQAKSLFLYANITKGFLSFDQSYISNYRKYKTSVGSILVSMDARFKRPDNQSLLANFTRITTIRDDLGLVPLPLLTPSFISVMISVFESSATVFDEVSYVHPFQKLTLGICVGGVANICMCTCAYICPDTFTLRIEIDSDGMSLCLPQCKILSRLALPITILGVSGCNRHVADTNFKCQDFVRLCKFTLPTSVCSVFALMQQLPEMRYRCKSLVRSNWQFDTALLLTFFYICGCSDMCICADLQVV
jgi:hypothetical protein